MRTYAESTRQPPQPPPPPKQPPPRPKQLPPPKQQRRQQQQPGRHLASGLVGAPAARIPRPVAKRAQRLPAPRLGGDVGAAPPRPRPQRAVGAAAGVVGGDGDARGSGSVPKPPDVFAARRVVPPRLPLVNLAPRQRADRRAPGRVGGPAAAAADRCGGQQDRGGAAGAVGRGDGVLEGRKPHEQLDRRGAAGQMGQPHVAARSVERKRERG